MASNPDAPQEAKMSADIPTYEKGPNKLDMASIYRNIKGLTSHPGRGKLVFSLSPRGQQVMLVHPCTPAFMDTFWTACANLLDYFADFLATDTQDNQIIWFHMLDMLQEAAKLPHTWYTDEFPRCAHAESFSEQYEQTLKLMNEVIKGGNWRGQDNLVHGEVGLTEPAVFSTGPWKNGIQPWGQYMLRDSPGFDVQEDWRVYPEGAEPPQQVGDAMQEEEAEVVKRCVPRGALAIVQRHTERARVLAEHYAEKNTTIDPEDFINEFDAHALKLDEPTKYTTLTALTRRVTPFYCDPRSHAAPRHMAVWSDFTGEVDYPSLWLMDEAVASYKGSPQTDHTGGEDKFWLMHVQDEKGSTGDREEVNESLEKKLGTLWDNWTIEE